MKKREIGNLFLHMGVGGALAGAVLYHHWFLLLATFVYAALREQAQHRYRITSSQVWVVGEQSPVTIHNIEKRTFFDFGWLGGKQVWEIFQWVIGCLVALGVYEFIVWEWLT